MEYTRIVQAVAGQPWAIDEDKGRAIAELIAFKASGGSYTRDEIEARTGEKRDMPQPTGGAAIIPLHGVMFQRAGMMAEISGGVSTDKVLSAVNMARLDDSVESIIIHIDSPGGSVYGTRELGAAVADAARVKTVVAQVDSVAASAAYWVASQASEIVVTPGGDVGSIGVISVHEDISRRLEEKGITETIIYAGKYKAEGNPYQPLGEEARDHLQARVDDAYRAFLEAVAIGRGVSPAEVEEKYGQGRVLSADAALSAGMVDRVATFRETLERYVQPPTSGMQQNRYSRRAMVARVAKAKAGHRH